MAAPAPCWPLLTMPCLTIQSLRLFPPLPSVWVRKGHTERWEGQGQGYWCRPATTRRGLCVCTRSCSCVAGVVAGGRGQETAERVSLCTATPLGPQSPKRAGQSFPSLPQKIPRVGLSNPRMAEQAATGLPAGSQEILMGTSGLETLVYAVPSCFTDGRTGGSQGAQSRQAGEEDESPGSS